MEHPRCIHKVQSAVLQVPLALNLVPPKRSTLLTESWKPSVDRRESGHNCAREEPMKSRIVAGAVALAFSVAAQAQDKYEVKVATFVGPQHFMNKWLEQWGGKLEKASNGRLAFKFFHGAQMAPAPAHYDLARSGQADVSCFLHGGTPGRFPLTELISLPYMAGSAEIGTKTVNDAGLRDRKSTRLNSSHRCIS